MQPKSSQNEAAHDPHMTPHMIPLMKPHYAAMITHATRAETGCCLQQQSKCTWNESWTQPKRGGNAHRTDRLFQSCITSVHNKLIQEFGKDASRMEAE